MKASIYIFFLVLMGMGVNSFGQDQKRKQSVLSELQRQKQQQQNYYRKTLQVDSVKAKEVSAVQDAYKSALKVVIADTSLNEAARRVRIGELMEIKNRKLRSMLSPAQQEKIIPTTERMPSKAVRPAEVNQTRP